MERHGRQMALVFIVEDDNDIRQIEAYALKCGGFEIEEFEDAKENTRFISA